MQKRIPAVFMRGGTSKGVFSMTTTVPVNMKLVIRSSWPLSEVRTLTGVR